MATRTRRCSTRSSRTRRPSGIMSAELTDRALRPDPLLHKLSKRHRHWGNTPVVGSLYFIGVLSIARQANPRRAFLSLTIIVLDRVIPCGLPLRPVSGQHFAEKRAALGRRRLVHRADCQVGSAERFSERFVLIESPLIHGPARRDPS